MSPKTFRRNDASLNLLLPSDRKRQIKALSLVWGGDGRVLSYTVRRIFKYWFDALEEDWPINKPKDWADYESSLANLYRIEELEAQELAEKLELEESKEIFE